MEDNLSKQVNKALCSFEPSDWSGIKNLLQKQLFGPLIHSVLNSTTLESFTSQQKTHLTLKVPSPLHQNTLRFHFSKIESTIKNYGLLYDSINIKIEKNLFQEDFIKKPLLLPKKEASFTKKKGFSSRWTFSSFISGPSNLFAFSLAKSIAKKPFNNTNPLFIYGPSGIGKTHLLHAILNDLSQKKPELNVCYLSAERFFNDCINHIRKNEMHVFRKKYRQKTHVLLLDDVQILGRGDSTQEEFFHTFEHLKQHGCQIVLASDQKPKDIKGLKQRIKTRFSGGVVTDIQTPDIDTKTAIIKHKIKNMSLSLNKEAIDYIAHLSTSSIRELEGQLNKVKMFCELQNKKPSFFLIKNILLAEDNSILKSDICSSSFRSSAPNTQKIKRIQKEICSFFHINASDLKSKSRTKNLVLARNLIIFFYRKELKLSLVEIGQLLGNRNHTTILNSLKNINKNWEEIIKTINNIDYLKNLIHKKL